MLRLDAICLAAAAQATVVILLVVVFIYVAKPSCLVVKSEESGDTRQVD